MDMDVIARLGRAAGQAAGMEKAALGGTGALNTVRSWLGSGIGAMARNPGRTLGTVGGLGAAYGTHNLANEHRLSTSGRSLMNPYTWFAPSNDEQAFQHANAQYDAMAQPIVDKMQAAIGKGDQQQVDALQKQLDTNNFGNPGWGAMFNPFAHSAGYYQRGAAAIQNKLQGQYDQEVGKSGLRDHEWARMDLLKKRLQETGLLPAQAKGLQTQLDALQARATTRPGIETPDAAGIRQRMQSMKMRFRAPNQFPQYDNVGWGPGQVPPPVKHNVDPSTRLRDWGQFESMPKPNQSTAHLYPQLRPGG